MNLEQIIKLIDNGEGDECLVMAKGEWAKGELAKGEGRMGEGRMFGNGEGTKGRKDEGNKKNLLRLRRAIARNNMCLHRLVLDLLV